MKKTIYFMSIIALTSFMSISCSQEDEITDSTVVAEEVADDIAASLGSSNSGISSEITEIAGLADEYISDQLKSALSDTVYSVDTSFTRENQAGTLITYSYSYQMEYGYVFDGVSLDNLYYKGSVNGSFDAPRIGSSDDRSSDWSLTGLEISSSNYILNGSTIRTGNSVSKIRNKSQVTSNSQISLSNVKINKSALTIIEGTLTWNISGTVNEQNYNFVAIVSYLGNGKAELILDGITYTIDIVSGEIEY